MSIFLQKNQAKRLFRSRLFITVILFLLQLLLLTAVGDFLPGFVLRILSILTILWILSRDDDSSYKISWTLLILLIPLPGCLFYLLFGNKRFGFNMKEQLESYMSVQNFSASRRSVTLTYSPISSYLQQQGAALHQNCLAEYFPCGEELFQKLLDDLTSAKRFIFLEYFIISEGQLWNSILHILEEKAQQGIDIRILYDDAGCLSTLPYGTTEELRQKGIHCAVFNPIHPRLNTFLNYRDHRKLCIIDAEIAYTGGANLSDEYVNLIQKHGHWKDCGIRIQGKAAENFTSLFLQLWQFTTGEPVALSQFSSEKSSFKCPGFVQPFGSDPMLPNSSAKNVLLHCFNRAESRLWIMTPYLIPDSETLCSLRRSALSGVDVRIILPHIPDKWYVHSVTRSFYRPLLESGVRIFEYTPGFIHSKVVLSDNTALVGSINLDYRSLYLQFESAVALYDHPVIHSIQDDFLNTQSVSEEIDGKKMQHEPMMLRFLRSLLRYFAPLM